MKTLVEMGLLSGLCVGVLLGDVSSSGGDSEGARNQAAKEDHGLQQGKGWAAQFPGDAGAKEHASYIFGEDFESEDYADQWDERRDPDGKVLSRVDPGDPESRLGDACLKVTATLGENTGGGLTKWFESSDHLFVRFYVKFAPDSDYIHHFPTLRANRSLQGRDRWSGFGGAGNKPDGDERFSTALEPWGDWGNISPPGKWNFYSYWHTMKASPDGRFWGNAFRPAEQPEIEKDQWICVELMVKHNTPGENDGEQAYWVDGELAGYWKDINWRTDEKLMANSLTLETYVTDRWTETKTNIVYFDNLLIGNEYIGPSSPVED